MVSNLFVDLTVFVVFTDSTFILTLFYSLSCRKKAVTSKQFHLINRSVWTRIQVMHHHRRKRSSNQIGLNQNQTQNKRNQVVAHQGVAHQLAVVLVLCLDHKIHQTVPLVAISVQRRYHHRRVASIQINLCHHHLRHPAISRTKIVNIVKAQVK